MGFAKTKDFLAHHAPGGLVTWAWEMRKRFLPTPGQRRETELYEKLGDPRTVLDGPFQGMSYHRVAYAGSTLDRTLGVYELEIRPAIEKLIALKPDLVVDIGTSDGYYLVGMARRLPEARLVGYDMYRMCRHITRRLSRHNGVSGRCEVRGTCTAADLQSVLDTSKTPVIICDCDGGEDPILRPREVAGLARATILVELHDVFIPGISDEIRRRFEPTHRIELIPVRTHAASDVPSRFGLSQPEAAEVVAGQRRSDNFWYLMTPSVSQR
jgi:hypothetical protein